MRPDIGSFKKLTFRPLTPETWSEFETLFGSRGACGGCWCMAWRLPREEFEKRKGSGNKKAMKKLVESGEQTGMIAFLDGLPVGWCSFAPREKYIMLERSRVLKPVDEKPVWSVSCLFIAKEFRRKGLSSAILKGVIDFCSKKKVDILEAYPILPYSDNMPGAFAWTGFASSYKYVGFKLAKKWSKSRPILRYHF